MTGAVDVYSKCTQNRWIYSVDYCLDPFDQFQREHPEDVLRRVGLVRDKDNNSGDAVGEVLRHQVLAGDGLSAGEQQLLSFARALMHIEHGQVRLVIMDEPTANIDMATDYKGRQV